ncbi:MAG: hypothetical protein ACYCTV_04690 [Leptospirales bacterium]
MKILSGEETEKVTMFSVPSRGRRRMSGVPIMPAIDLGHLALTGAGSGK